MATNWKDPDKQDQLRRLWHEGHSCSAIARIMGGDITRNAVIGAVSRAGLPRRGPTSPGTKPRLAQRLYRKPQMSSAPKPLSPAAQVIKAIKCDGLPLPTPAETDVPRKALIDLERHHCRWVCSDKGHPLYDARYCGLKAVPGLPYCDAHTARAFAPPQPRRRDLPVVVGKEMAVA